MNRSVLLAALALAAVLTTTTPAHARYHDGMNLYEYAGSRSTGSADPSGRRITDFEDCSAAQQATLTIAHNTAVARLNKLQQFVKKYSVDIVWTDYMTKNARRNGGMPTHEEQAVWDSYRRAMLRTIKKMQAKFTSGLHFECECKCDKEITWGYVWFVWSDVHFCPRFFNANAPINANLDMPQEQMITVLHETSHMLGTGHYSLDWNVEAGWLTTGGWFPKLAADDAWWFDELVYKGDYEAHEENIWEKIWPAAN